MGHKNYYSLLDIPTDASEDIIKKAYRKLALKYHTDKTNDKKTVEKFTAITEAKNILLDVEKRKEYDNRSQTVLSPSLSKAIKLRRGIDLRVNLNITVNDLANESVKNIQTTRMCHCPECGGTGTTTKILTPCFKCNGTGIDLVSTVMGQKSLCSLCKGYGSYQEKPDCPKCHGTGLTSEKIIRKIKISKDYKSSIVIPQSGNYVLGGNIPGDLIINLNMEKTDSYEIEGRNIKGILKVSPAQAVLGDIIFINVFSEMVKVILPANSKNSYVIKQENAGILKNGKRGSLILTVIIDIPKNISEEEKNLYKQLLKLQKGY